MLPKKRTKTKVTRRNNRKKSKRFLSLIVCLVAMAGVLSAIFFLRKPSLVSPAPKVLAGESSNRSAVSSPDLHAMIQAALDRKSIFYTSVVKTGSDYTISLKDEGDAVLSGEKDISEQISSLQVVLTRLTMEGKHFSRLDLRFDKPVVSLR